MKKKLAWLTVSGTIGLLLCSCSHAPQAPGSTSTASPRHSDASKEAEKVAGSKVQEAASSSGSNSVSSGARVVEPAVQGEAAAAGGTDSAMAAPAAADSGKAKVAPSQADAGKAKTVPSQADSGKAKAASGQKNVNVENLPPTMTILTVAGQPITVGEYRRMFKMQQVQLESMAMNNPQVRANLIEQSKKLKLSLTPDERSKLLAAAHRSKAPDEAGFQKFLKEHNISQDQFDKEISDVGLAVKAVNVILQQSLLNDLINRELLCRAASAAGLSKKASDAYATFKSSSDYKQLSQATNLSADDLKGEITKNQLSKLMVEKLQSRAVASDKEVEQVYGKNKQKLQHKERVRLSQIIVACPSVDAAGVVSVRSQLKKENPKLEGKELDAKVTQVMENQKRKAETILVMAKEGKSFSDLANTLSDDMRVKKGKSGGDMGYQEKGQLIPELAKAVWDLKAGTVYPGLVQTALGYHIIKVTEHQAAGTASLSEVKPQLKMLVLQQKQQQSVNNWLRDKRSGTQLVLAPQFASLLNQGASSQTSSLNTSLPH